MFCHLATLETTRKTGNYLVHERETDERGVFGYLVRNFGPFFERGETIVEIFILARQTQIDRTKSRLCVIYVVEKFYSP